MTPEDNTSSRTSGKPKERRQKSGGGVEPVVAPIEPKKENGTDGAAAVGSEKEVVKDVKKDSDNMKELEEKPAPVASSQDIAQPELTTDSPTGTRESSTPPADPSTQQDNLHRSMEAVEPVRSKLTHLNITEFKSELPPPFYPANPPQKPSSTFSSNGTYQQSGIDTSASLPPSRPNADGIVFGGFRDSSDASPGAPPSAESAFFTPQGLTFMNGGPPPPAFSPTGHEHSFSGSYSGGPSTAQYNGRNEGFYDAESSSQYVQPSMQQHQSNGGPPGLQRPAPINGYSQQSRSNSLVSTNTSDQVNPQKTHINSSVQSFSSNPIGGDAVNGAHETQRGPLTYQRREPTMHLPRLESVQRTPEADQKNVRDLVDHLKTQFGSFEFADYVVEIADEQVTLHTIPCHGLILARSPRFQIMMRSSSSEDRSMSPKSLRLPKQFYFQKSDGLIEAMRYLYGVSLLDEGRYVHSSLVAMQQQQDPLGARQVLADRMSYILSYTAAGCMMDIPELVFRGLQIAHRLLRWENLETALSFALNGGLGNAWRDEYALDDRGSSTSSEDSLARIGDPTYDPHATYFLQYIVGFICFNFPRDFVLDTSAPQLSSLPRLPQHAAHASRPFASDPRLKGIRFGESQTDELKGTDPAGAILSSTLLSLPLPVVRATLEHPILGEILGWPVVSQLIHEIIAEREKRRLGALKEHSARISDIGGDSNLVQNLFWEEAVEASHQHPCGLKLVRRRKGIDTPHSSASAASK